MFSDSVAQFPKQLAFVPRIENKDKLTAHDAFVVTGMGGSHLAADLLLAWNPELDLYIHSDYGKPPLPQKELSRRLCIASSYSGNTEEVIDAFEWVVSQKFPVAAVATGGMLLERAKTYGIPYIQLPDWGIQPRSAVGLSAVALLALMAQTGVLKELQGLSKTLDPEAQKETGRALAKKLDKRVPIIYASNRNRALALNWKIRLNETGKVPSFFNTVPELNHNEIIGFDITPHTKPLSERFIIVILRDDTDEPRVNMRMELLADLYREKGLEVHTQRLEGVSSWEKIFSSILLADWTSYFVAEQYGLDSEQVDFVEEFKRRLREKERQNE